MTVKAITKRVKWRDKTQGWYTAVSLGAGLAGCFFFLLGFCLGANILLLVSLACVVITVGILAWYPAKSRLNERDIDVLLASKEANVLPLLAECHYQFSLSTQPEDLERAQRLRERAFQVLRDQQGNPSIEISRLRLQPVI